MSTESYRDRIAIDKRTADRCKGWPETFLFGANLPWFDYGLDFGANAWRPGGGVGRHDARERVMRELETIAATGVRSVRWFLFCDGRAGIRFDHNGRPIGLDEWVCRDIDMALELAGRARLTVMFVLLDFHWCHAARLIDGVQIGGRVGVLRDQRSREALLELVFRPVLERYAKEPAIFAWDLMNEPEWVEWGGMVGFISDAVCAIRTFSARPVTVGSASARWRKRYRDMNLDFDQVHWYDSVAGQSNINTPVARLGFERPVILGEFPTRGSRKSWQEIIAAARTAGYAGAFYWSALSTDRCSDPAARPFLRNVIEPGQALKVLED